MDKYKLFINAKTTLKENFCIPIVGHNFNGIPCLNVKKLDENKNLYEYEFKCPFNEKTVKDSVFSFFRNEVDMKVELYKSIESFEIIDD